MKYNLINLKDGTQTIILKKENMFFNNKNKKINLSNNDFILNNEYLIPESILSNNMILSINEDNYWLTKISKYNKYFDAIIKLSNEQAFDLYYYFKNKDNIVDKAEKCINVSQIKKFKKFCWLLLLNIDKYKNKEYTNEYILAQILLYLTGQECDSKCFFLIKDY